PAAIEKIDMLVGDALGKGASVRLGCAAGAGPGFFYPPSVLADVPLNAAILREEVFGPVAAVVPFKDVEDAVRMANDTEYGLAAYVYTGDMKRGLQLAERLEYGMVALNRGLVSDPAAPFGGVKQSGLGREGAHHGLLEFTEAKYVAVNW
ncbi:MAG: NAD-dependent succinate-semialdehyde dehydrogenase, partial [Rhodobacterales bacterium 17-64-5]